MMSILFFALYWRASEASLIDRTCGQNMSRVFGQRLVDKFPDKLEDGFKKCSWRCVKNPLCETFGHVNGSCRQYTRDGNALLARFDDNCKTNSDCSYTHGQCLRGHCSCWLGYSYDFEKNVCVEECGNYGPLFSVYADHDVPGCNIRILEGLPSVESCTGACRDEPHFLCINVEYLNGRCLMCDETWAEMLPANRGSAPGWQVGYRHCQ